VDEKVFKFKLQRSEAVTVTVPPCAKYYRIAVLETSWGRLVVSQITNSVGVGWQTSAGRIVDYSLLYQLINDLSKVINLSKRKSWLSCKNKCMSPGNASAFSDSARMM
jgi:hypothetical protein